MIINSIFYYLFFSSVTLIYGIGIKQSIVATKNPEYTFVGYIKLAITVTLSSFLSFLLINYLLIPANMVELYPFICLFIVLIIGVFCEAVIRLTAHNSTAEISVSFLCTLLAVNESTTMLQSVVNSFICITCCALLMPILIIFRKRLSYSYPHHSFNHGSLIFISLAIILITFVAINVSWLMPGVLK